MTRYELTKNTEEFWYKNREQIQPGCTVNNDRDQDPEIIKIFDNKEEAMEELAKYESDIHVGSGALGTLYTVTEYYVAEMEYDDEGEFVSGGDIWDFSEMDLSVLEDDDDEEDEE